MPKKNAGIPAKKNVAQGAKAKGTVDANQLSVIDNGFTEVENLVTKEEPMAEILMKLGYLKGLVHGALGVGI